MNAQLPFEPLILTHYQPTDEMRAPFTMLGRHIPSKAVGAAWTFGVGPWNAFISRASASKVTLWHADGRVDQKLFGDIREDGEWQEEICTAFSNLVFCLSNDRMLKLVPAMGFIARAHAVIVIIHKQGEARPRACHYIPSPLASGHDLVEDPARLAREFPGRFILEGS